MGAGPAFLYNAMNKPARRGGKLQRVLFMSMSGSRTALTHIKGHSGYRCGLVSQADSVRNSGVMGAMSYHDDGDHWSKHDIGHHPSMII